MSWSGRATDHGGGRPDPRCGGKGAALDLKDGVMVTVEVRPIAPGLDQAAAALMALKHSAVPRFVDAFATEEWYWLVQEYLPAKTMPESSMGLFDLHCDRRFEPDRVAGAIHRAVRRERAFVRMPFIVKWIPLM